MYAFAIILTIVSNVFYHIIQKATPTNVNAMLALAATYAVATVVCLMMLPFFPPSSGLAGSLKQLNWASYALGLAVIGLELGFLMAYRAGWNISQGAAVSNVAVALLLLPIGILLLKEEISTVNVVGIVFCALGLILINWR
jgi:uncharacterized membrane protein